MKNKKYYLAKLVGITPSFKLKDEDLYIALDKTKKIVYDEIIVTKEKNKYKEIITGKKYESLDLIYNKEDNVLERKVPYTSYYIVNDLKYRNILLREATNNEINFYLNKYNNKQLLLNKLNYIESLCNSYFFKELYFNSEKENYVKNLLLKK